MGDFIPTNTLANTDLFDIMKMDAVDDPLINLDNYTSVDFDESYFAQTVHFINESTDEITDNKIKFYKSLSEASNEVAVLESFSDYFSGVRAVINKVIKFLKNLVEKFITALNKFVKSDSYLSKHIKELSGFKDESDKFTFSGYNFVFDDNIPSAVALASFDANLFSDIRPNNGSLDMKNITDAISIRNLDDLCDNFRGEVIGKTEPIYATEFQDELFKVYRNGDGSSVDIDATSIYIRQISDRYTNHTKMETRVKNQEKEVIKVYDNIQKQVNNVVRSNGNLNTQAFLNNLPSGTGIQKIDSTYVNSDGMTMSGDLMAQIDIYIRGKVEEIKARSDIHLLAFSAKLDAIKDAYKQDRNVLYTALSKVTKSGDRVKKENAEFINKGMYGDSSINEEDSEKGTDDYGNPSEDYSDDSDEYTGSSGEDVEESYYLNEEDSEKGTDDYGNPVEDYSDDEDTGSSGDDDYEYAGESASIYETGPIRKTTYKLGDWLDSRAQKRVDKLTAKLKKEGVKIPYGMTPYKRAEYNKLILVDKKDKVHIMNITTGNVDSTGMSIYEYKQNSKNDSQNIVKTASSVATKVV